ncbi:MAG: glycosyltransferase family 39 protein [Saprospiraceae bacterium]
MKHSNKRQTPPPKSKQPLAKPPVVGSPGGAFPVKKILVYGTLVAAILFVFFVRFRLLSLPLERDEGEYALMGQLILKGIPPYEMAYNMKLPGTYYAYALLMAIFGQSPEGVHAGLLVVNLASIVLLFFVGKKLVNDIVGVLAAVSFALLTLAPYTLGLSAHATHFNALAALGGFYLLLKFADRPTLLRLASSGFCFGLAFIMKQQAMFLLIFGLIALLLFEMKRTPRNPKRSLFNVAVFGFSIVMPYLLVVLVAVATGSFDKFWHWTVDYARQYATIKPWDQAWGSLKANFDLLSIGMIPFWIVGAAGLAALFFSEATRKYRWTILAFTLFSALCVVPGLYFRQHYFIVFYPALALLVGIALNFLREWLIAQNAAALSVLPFGVFAYMLFSGVKRHTEQLFKDNPERLCTRMFGSANPFPESLKIAEFIRTNSKPDDKVAVLGSEPQICFYSNRLPATGFIYTYPLMENQAYSQAMQQEMIAEIEQSKPKFLVYINSPLSWLRKPQSSGAIFEWFNDYKMQYKLAGIVEISPGKRTVYAWREALETHTEKGETRVSVYERE